MTDENINPDPEIDIDVEPLPLALVDLGNDTDGALSAQDLMSLGDLVTE